MDTKQWNSFFKTISSKGRWYYQSRRTCSQCDMPITDMNKTGLCKPHWLGSKAGCTHSKTLPYNKGRVCRTCRLPIRNKNKTGYCRKCLRAKQISTKGCSYITTQGYRYILVDGRYIPEHRYIWEQTHHCRLPKKWVVHHLNGIKNDNRPENLEGLPRKRHSATLVLKACQKRIRLLEETIVQFNLVKG